MSLSTAAIVLAIELTVVAILAFTTRNRSARATRLVRAFGIFATLSAFWAFGLAGTDEVMNQNSGATWLTAGLAALNCIVFVTLHTARERMKYGSNPA
jgi:hypothetical protein